MPSRNALYLLPTIPAELQKIDFTQKVGEHQVKINYLFNDDIMRITLDGSGVKDSIDIGTGMFNRADANYQVKTVLKTKDVLVIEIPSHSNTIQDLIVTRNGERIAASAQIYNEPISNFELYENLRFAKPVFNKNWKALQGPAYQLLPNELVKKNNPSAKTIISKTAPEGDEIYSYPTNPNFQNGILDLTFFELKEDQDNYYFHLKYKKLNNPGWHNEYGFQLTFSSICISTDNPAAKSRNVSSNSNYLLPAERAYDRIIRVGGGFEIAGSDNTIIAAYLPESEDIKAPLSDTKSSSIKFSIPKKYLGKITAKSVISVLTGAQDDHGGAGVGEFRTVGSAPGEWTGGGKKNAAAHNIYDILYIN